MPKPSAGQFPNPTQPPFNLANIPFTDQDPVMDGKATNQAEWAKGLRLPDTYFFGNTPRSGFYYFESRLNWTATSVATKARATYEGTTLFVSHDIIGADDPKNPLHQFQVDRSSNWNSFEFQTPAGTVRIWVFENTDDPDDRKWLPFAEGLANSSLIPEGVPPNLIDDRGFIARLNDDPATDVHWLPGMPEPGDPGWNWAAWHYVFGRYSFGDSFQSVGVDNDPKNAVPHQVYEFCCYQSNWKLRTAKKRRPGKKRWPPAPGPAPWCIWWDTTDVNVPHSETVVVLVDGHPVKATLTTTETIKVPVLRGQFWLHFWDPAIFQAGVPSCEQQVQFIEGQLSALLEEAPGRAQSALTDALGCFRQAFSQLSAGSFADAFQSFGKMAVAIKKSKKLGVDPLQLIDTEMQVLSLVSTEASNVVMQLDARTTLKDRNLKKAYLALYDFGRILAKGRNRGLRFQAVKTTGELKPVFDAVARAQKNLLRG